MQKIKKTIALLMTSMLLVAALAGCGGSSGSGSSTAAGSGTEGSTGGAASSGSGDTIVVGGKDYTEALFTSEIIAQMLENYTDLKVERKYNLAAAVCFEAVKRGEIDIFPEYTGTGLIHYLLLDPVDTPEETYQIVKDGYKEEWNLIWLDEWGFNNTYANAITRAFSEEHGITTNSQLAPFTPDLVYGADVLFYDREDGFDNMCATYGFNFKNSVGFNVSMVYQAMSQGEMDVASVYSTDGLLSQYDLVVLEDDLNYFPAYYLAPVVGGDMLDAHPEIAEVMAKLEGVATEQDMISYNYKIDIKELTLEEAATQFLQEKGLL